MSYIIAFVRFSESEMDYPVACYRTDIRPSEDVIVRLSNSELKPATVVRVNYLNWDCKGRIECKISEATASCLHSQRKPDFTEITVGLATMEATVEHLRLLGWIPLKPISKQYRVAVINYNNTQTANIFFRKNVVDLQIISELPSTHPSFFSKINVNFSEGRTVRHFLSQTNFNLYEGIDRFAKCFLSNEENYDRFFKSVGSSNRTTQEVKSRMLNSSPEKEMSLRQVLSGCEDATGRIYLCDGIYI